MEKIPTVELAPHETKWVSVKDREGLPKLNEDVIVVSGCWWGVWSLHITGDGTLVWEDSYGNYQDIDEVDYWTSRPIFPKENKEDI